MKIKVKIYLLGIFILFNQGCSMVKKISFTKKIKYSTTIKVNGKVTTERYIKIEGAINSLPNNSKIKLRGYIIERTDLKEYVEYSANHRILYQQDSILTKGDLQDIEALELKNEVKGIIDNNYIIYDKIIELNDKIDLTYTLDSFLQNNNKNKNEYKALLYINVRNVKGSETIVCPTSITSIQEEDEQTLCMDTSDAGFLDAGFFFRWKSNPVNFHCNFLFTIIETSTNKEIYQATINSQKSYLSKDNFGYLLSSSIFQFHIKDKFPNIYGGFTKPTFRWKITSLCDDDGHNNLPITGISDIFTFGKCPDSKNEATPCSHE